MTAIVSILCRDGAVVGTDGSVTLAITPQHPTIEQPTEKIDVVGEHVIVAATGEVGLGQRLRLLTERAWKGEIKRAPKNGQPPYDVFRNRQDPVDVAKDLSAMLIEDTLYTHMERLGPQGALRVPLGAVVAFPCGDAPCVAQFAPETFQPEMLSKRLWFCSMGRTQEITDAFLGLMRGTLWNTLEAGELPPLREGVLATTWALRHAIEVNPGGVNEPIQLAVLERKKGKLSARLLSAPELQEHRQSVEEFKEHLRRFPELFNPEKAEDVPAPNS